MMSVPPTAEPGDYCATPQIAKTLKVWFVPEVLFMDTTQLVLSNNG